MFTNARRLELVESVARETGVIRAELRVKQDALFAEFDRYQSEAELRSAIVPPLTVLILVLAVRDTAAWALGMLAVVVLIRQASNAGRRSLDVLGTALRLGIVRSPSMDSFEMDVRSTFSSTDD